MVSCLPPPSARRSRSRSAPGTTKATLLSFICVLALGLAGAAFTANHEDEAQPDAEAAGPALSAARPARFAGANQFPPLETTTAGAEPRQDASDLTFAAPTDLGIFASKAPHAPRLDSGFVALALQTPARDTAATPGALAQAANVPVEIPQPLANPFRPQSSEADASRKVKLASRPPRNPPASATAPANGEKGFLERLFGANEPRQETALAYAPVDTGDLRGWPVTEPQRRGGAGEKTAIYDISSKIVTLPNGQRLEAHSGFGDLLDDPRSMHVKNRGVTPPNIYNLRLRESLFHGVRAIRLIPENETRMFGRDGILAHTYMLGPRGDSNGCISFRDYDAFLNAFLKGEVTRIVVIDGPSSTFALAAARR